MDKVKKLNSIKKDIEKAQEEHAQSKGRLQTLMDQLLKDFKCKTVKEAEKKLKSFEIQLNKLQDDFENKFSKLEESYEWD